MFSIYVEFISFYHHSIVSSRCLMNSCPSTQYPYRLTPSHNFFQSLQRAIQENYIKDFAQRTGYIENATRAYIEHSPGRHGYAPKPHQRKWNETPKYKRAKTEDEKKKKALLLAIIKRSGTSTGAQPQPSRSRATFETYHNHYLFLNSGD